jgi:hypothetical protein
MHRNNAKPYHFIFKTGKRPEYFSAESPERRLHREAYPMQQNVQQSREKAFFSGCNHSEENNELLMEIASRF